MGSADKLMHVRRDGVVRDVEVLTMLRLHSHTSSGCSSAAKTPARIQCRGASDLQEDGIA